MRVFDSHKSNGDLFRAVFLPGAESAVAVCIEGPSKGAAGASWPLTLIERDPLYTEVTEFMQEPDSELAALRKDNEALRGRVGEQDEQIKALEQELRFKQDGIANASAMLGRNSAVGDMQHCVLNANSVLRFISTNSGLTKEYNAKIYSGSNPAT